MENEYEIEFEKNQDVATLQFANDYNVSVNNLVIVLGLH